MKFQPPLQDAARYPLSSVIAGGAIAISLSWWAGGRWVEWLVIANPLLERPWTLLTSTLAHVDLVHLLFNLVWWWPLATRVERAWGSSRLLAVAALCAIISSAAELAVSVGGVGLSGVVYGLCTMLWVLRDRVPEFAGVVTARTLGLFAAWFVVCIALTVTGTMAIGNTAHAAGAAVGWGLGRCLLARRERRRSVALLLGLAGCAALALAIVRPGLLLAIPIGSDAQRGAAALSAGRYVEAEALLRAAAAKAPDEPTTLVNLGITLQQLDRSDEALPLYKRAAARDPSLRPNLAPAIASILFHQAVAAGEAGDLERARRLAAEGVQWMPRDADGEAVLRWINELEESEIAPMFGPPE